MSHSQSPATLCVHAGEDRHGQNRPLTTEIAQTAVFAIPDVETLRRMNAGEPGYMYSRYANPTVRAAEEKIAALEGAEDCVVTATGMAAETILALAFCQAGDEIVSMLDIYGGTLVLFEKILPRFGITVKLAPFGELDHVEQYFTPKTKMLFLESPTNPTLRSVDLAALAAKGKSAGLTVVVDNTFATPILQRPLELGADVTFHSATKYLGGHSDVTAGAICGSKALMEPVRQLMYQSGGSLDPGAAYLLIRGLKTLELRVERACRNARQIAEALRAHPKVARVMWPGFPETDGHDAARRQMKDFGMMLSLELKGGGPAAEKFINSLKLWYLATSLGGVESTVSYPVLASHANVAPDRLELMDVSPATVRLSVGIEDAGDLLHDLNQALATV